jgi:predicted urease superfamily metal-dependent hydrolase
VLELGGRKPQGSYPAAKQVLSLFVCDAKREYRLWFDIIDKLCDGRCVAVGAVGADSIRVKCESTAAVGASDLLDYLFVGRIIQSDQCTVQVVFGDRGMIFGYRNFSFAKFTA